MRKSRDVILLWGMHEIMTGSLLKIISKNENFEAVAAGTSR